MNVRISVAGNCSFVPSGIPSANLLFWHDLGLSVEAINPDGTGGPPSNDQEFAWLTSLVNDGTADNQWTSISFASPLTNKQPIYRTGVINGLPAAYWTINDGLHNSVLFTNGQQPAIDGDQAMSFYYVARFDGLDGDYRPLWRYGAGVTGGFFSLVAYTQKWFLDSGHGTDLYNRYAAVDGNWHVFTVIKPTGNFLAGVKFYIDGVLQMVTASAGVDQPLNIVTQRFLTGCNDNTAGEDTVWQGYLAADAGYLAAHSDVVRGQIETYFKGRYGL